MSNVTTMRRRSSSEASSDYEKERERKRRLWMIQQEKEREHERLKQKKIEEYEKKRAKALGLPYKGRSSHRSRSKSRSRSRSEEPRQRSHSRPAHNNGPQVVPKEPNSMTGNKPLFNGPSEAPKLNENDLRQVTVKIHRKIPAPAAENSEIKREVINPEEITLKRREVSIDLSVNAKSKFIKELKQNYHQKAKKSFEDPWHEEDIHKRWFSKRILREGSKPIFDRDELKAQLVEVEERRIVEASGRSNQDKRPRSKRRSVSLSPRRHRSPSPHSRSGRSGSRSRTHRSRREEYRHHSEDRHHKDNRSDRHHSRTRNGSREDSRRHRSPRRRSPSRERDHRRSERDYPRSSRSEKDYREYRGRSMDRSYDRRDRRESSAERHRSSGSGYMEPMPYPVYFGGFPPRPVMIPPALPPIRLSAAGRGRLPVAPVRPPYPPRFGPPEMYRGILPTDPRYPRMY